MDTTFVGFPIVSVQLKIAAKLPYLEKISSIFQVIVIHDDFTKKNRRSSILKIYSTVPNKQDVQIVGGGEILKI